MKILIKYRTDNIYLEMPYDIPRTSKVLGVETHGCDFIVYLDNGVKILTKLPGDTVDFNVTFSS